MYPWCRYPRSGVDQPGHGDLRAEQPRDAARVRAAPQHVRLLHPPRHQPGRVGTASMYPMCFVRDAPEMTFDPFSSSLQIVKCETSVLFSPF